MRGIIMRRAFRWLGLAVAAVIALPGAARAEVSEVRLSQQFGLSYLPLIIAKDKRLIERHALAAGLPDLKVSWSQLSGGAAINDALLSGAIDYGAAGIAPLLTIWDKTRGSYDVKAVAALDEISLVLNTNNPTIKSLKDFTEKDRIALPAAKVSIQSVILQMAAEQAFGPGHHGDLDKLTVSLKHPDATAALLSGTTEVSAHFTMAPYSFQQLENPKIHSVLTSSQVLGGPTALNVVYTTTKFRDQNPKVYGAVLAALREADDFIATNRSEAARIYIEQEKSPLSPAFVERMLADPELKYSTVPSNTLKIADFMARIGSIKTRPASWRDYFFPDVHAEAGS